MEIFLALAAGLVVGLVVGFSGGAGWASMLFGRSLRREVDAGRLSREEAALVTDLKSVQ